MKIVLLGKNGQVGWELQRALAPLGELIALARDDHSFFCGNLTNLGGLTQTIRTLVPDVIVNAAAYTAVDKAESEMELAMLINAEAPRILAREAASIGALLVHYSTDYVFDGSGSNFWQETDSVAPLNYYGKSKLEGERAILASGCKHLIFRTSWIYSARGNNFAKTMLRLAREQVMLSVVNDQIGAPTGADLLADVTAHAIRMVLQNSAVNGLYHLATQGETSWYNYANFVIENARNLGEVFKLQALNPVTSADYMTPARRPSNSRLNTAKLSDTFSLCLPPWEIGVSRMLEEFLG